MSHMGKEIIDYCHKQGVKFTFDDDCDALNCENLSTYIQDITHPKEGKMSLNLCDKHIKKFNKDESFKVTMKVVN